MKRLIHFILLVFVSGSAFFFTATLAHPGTTTHAAPPAPKMSSANYAMDWNTAGSSRGGESASMNFKLRGTIGQMAASSKSASANYGECSGLQCVLDTLRIYLPVIIK